MFNKKVEPYPIYQATPEEMVEFDKQKEAGNYRPINIFDMLDSAIMKSLHLNDDQFDKFCEEATFEEMDLVVKENKTLSEAKQVAIILRKFRV